MAKTSPDLIPGAATGELAHGSLRLWDAITISVSVIAPGMAMLLNVTGVAAVAGGSTPLESTCSTGVGAAFWLVRMTVLLAFVEVSRCHCHWPRSRQA